MRFVFYLFIFSQLFNFVSVFADKYTKESPKLKLIKWEKIKENNPNNLKKIIWKSYNQDENYFNNKNKEGFSTNQFSVPKSSWIDSPTWRNRTLRFSFEEIDMPDASEHMGLYSIGAYDRLEPWLYGGITLYGAATGRRGGFFTGGYTWEWNVS